jgi:methionyl-tRNA synthetase
VKQGKKQRAPGCDGISHDFFQLTWETTQYDMMEIMNQMFMDEKLVDSQKQDIIVCLRKNTSAYPTRRLQATHPPKCRLQIAGADYCKQDSPMDQGPSPF